MGQIHNEIRRSPVGRGLTRALGVVDPEAALERFSETLQVIIDLWSQPEWAFLRDERLGWARSFEGAAVGLRSRVGIENPPGSGLLVVVDGIVNNGASTIVTLTVGTGLTIDTRTNPRPLDTRFHFPTGASLRARATERAGVIGGTTTALGDVRLTQGELYRLPLTILQPGWLLSCDPTTDNTLIDLCFFLRERKVRDGELGTGKL